MGFRQLLICWAIFAVVMCILPLILPPGIVRICIFANFLAIFALSWDFISGRTGYVSFGHPFLIAIGAYATAILSFHYGLPLILSIPAAVLFTLASGLFFFVPALRIRGTYFALVTLAFMELAYQLTQVVAPHITGGTRGLSGIQVIVSGAVPNFYLSFGILFAVAFCIWLIARTRLGTALAAVRMDEEAVTASGLSTIRLKLFAFGVSAFVAGIGGAFYVHYIGSIAPRAMFDINFLFQILVAALIGGSTTIPGPIIGAFFLTFLLEYLRPFIHGPERFLIFGSVALVVYVLQPNGIFNMLMQAWDRIAPGFRKLTPQSGQGS